MLEPDVVPVAPDMVVSETLGGYDLLRRLGSGGMAEVHLARANGIEGFQKLVVLKQILPHLSRDKHFVRMFLEEARLAALLDHPNVVQVFDLGKEEGEYFFTMEFVYGETLQGVLRGLRKVGQPLAVEHAVTIGLGVAAGLHYAHERVGFDGRPLGIVHRDVSPTNVMITYEGGVKVADFGIAKVVTRTDVTRAGTRKGKVPYMSPEQCRAEKIDRRSDVFSLGIVLWESVTGRRLFEGDNEFGVMNLIVNGRVDPPSAVRPGIPPELDRIIMKALTTDLGQRYQHSRELQIDLEAFARDQRLRATPTALGELMHYLFRPQPFPWGALRGNSGRGVMSPATLAEIGSAVGSQASVAGTGAGTGVSTGMGSGMGSGMSTGMGSGMSTGMSGGRSADVTGGAGSYGRTFTSASALSVGSAGSAGVSASATSTDPRSTTLRRIAIGLGSAAAASMVLVLGLWLGGRRAQDGETSETSSAEDAARSLEAVEAAAQSAEHTVLAPAEPESGPGEPGPGEPGPDSAGESGEPEPAGESGEPEPAGASGEPEPVGESGEPEPAGESGEPEAAPDEPDESDEPVIIEDAPSERDDERPRSRAPKSRGSSKPARKKPPAKKKPDLDSFMPGFG